MLNFENGISFQNIRIIPKATENQDKQRATLRDRINYHEVDDISEILIHKIPPYFEGNIVHTNCDVDGVIARGGKNNDPEKNLTRLLALRTIAKKSNKITLDSCRFITFPIGKKTILSPPLISKGYSSRLMHVLGEEKKAEIKIGLGKLLTCFGIDDGFFRTNLESLRNGADVAIIGNTLMDTIRVRKLVSKAEAEKKPLNTKKIHYFKTPGSII